MSETGGRRDPVTIDGILEFAIGMEQRSQRFYTGWAQKMENPAIREVFLEFAEEEHRHEALIEEVRSGKRTLRMRGGVADLKLSDHFVPPKATEEMGYQDALLLAIKREVGAIKLYEHLSNRAEDKSLGETFAALAEEEHRHKLRLETIYDDTFMRED
jgi:rubrerythrin